MAYIVTSKTRGRRSGRLPNGRTYVVAKHDGNHHIADERALEKRLRKTCADHLPDPQPIPGYTERQ